MNEYFVHKSSFVDDDVKIGKNTKIWHFCHIQKGAELGENCSLGQNVNIANNKKPTTPKVTLLYKIVV